MLGIEIDHSFQVTLAENNDTPPGLILPNGDINWNCPCLGGMAVGPCGVEFREAFSCFHYSQEEPKGKECLPKFADMQECMKQYPELYEEKKVDKEEAGEAQKAEEAKTEEDGAEDKATEAPTVTVVGTKDEEVAKPEAEPSSVKSEVADKEDPSEPAANAEEVKS